MAGVFTTIQVKDAFGANKPLLVWDPSGAGSGPYVFGPLGAENDSRETNPDATQTSAMALMRAGFFTADQILQFLEALATGETVPVALNTTDFYDGATQLTPKFAKIAASASGNNTLVALVASKKLRVLAYNLSGAGDVDAKFQSGASGTDLTGLKYLRSTAGGAHIVAPFNPLGWFETAAGVLLNLNLSAAVAVGGELTYVEV